MGIFSGSTPFDDVVAKATADTNTKEDWGLILDICDKVESSTTAPKECLKAIIKRLHHQDPHVVLQAITLLDACVSNCRTPFHLEVASRDFEQEFIKLLQKMPDKTIRDKLLGCLQKWAEDFSSNPQLDLIPSLYNKLKHKGYEFPSDSPHKSKKSSHKRDTSKHHDSGFDTQADDDLAKAIELSLKEAQAHSSNQSKRLYPETSLGTTSTSVKDDKPIKVRALYDFEAAEDNELTFYAGEIVLVTDDSDVNWWQGSNHRGKGLFPANFVTTDLSAEPQKFEVTSKKTVQFSEEVEVQSVETEPEVVEIDESKIDQVLHLLHEADPTGEVEDPPELATLEEQVTRMGPLIDQELERIDRRHAQLTRLGGELVEALNLYHNLMREPVTMGQPQPMSSYNNINGPTSTVSAPHFPAVSTPVQYGYGYDTSTYPGIRPPHSAPPTNGQTYPPINYQQSPQRNHNVIPSGPGPVTQPQFMNTGLQNGQIQSSQPTSMTQGPLPTFAATSGIPAVSTNVQYNQMVNSGMGIPQQSGFDISQQLPQPPHMGAPQMSHLMGGIQGPMGAYGAPPNLYQPQGSTASNPPST